MSQPLTAGEAVWFTLFALSVAAIFLALSAGLGYMNGYEYGVQSEQERHEIRLIEKGVGRYKDGKFEWKEP